MAISLSLPSILIIIFISSLANTQNITCPINSVYNPTQNTCVCQANATAFNSTSNTCTCKQNFIFSSTQKKCTCQPYFFYNTTDTTCTCKGSSYFNKNSTPPKCQTCSQPYIVYNKYSNICYLNCKYLPHTNFSSSELGCQCQYPYSFNSKINVFSCQLNCSLIPHTVGSAVNDTCVCIAPYVFDVMLKKCAINCSNIQNTIIGASSLLDECVCVPGYNWINFKCVVQTTTSSTIGLIVSGGIVGIGAIAGVIAYPFIMKMSEKDSGTNPQILINQNHKSSSNLIELGI